MWALPANVISLWFLLWEGTPIPSSVRTLPAGSHNFHDHGSWLVCEVALSKCYHTISEYELIEVPSSSHTY